jgi:hypothetical protein
MEDLPLRGSLKVLKISVACQGCQWHVAAFLVMMSYTILYSPFYWSNGWEVVTPDHTVCFHLNTIFWPHSPRFGSGGLVLHVLFQFCASYANLLRPRIFKYQIWGGENSSCICINKVFCVTLLQPYWNWGVKHKIFAKKKEEILNLTLQSRFPCQTCRLTEEAL